MLLLLSHSELSTQTTSLLEGAIVDLTHLFLVWTHHSPSSARMVMSHPKHLFLLDASTWPKNKDIPTLLGVLVGCCFQGLLKLNNEALLEQLVVGFDQGIGFDYMAGLMAKARVLEAEGVELIVSEVAKHGQEYIMQATLMKGAQNESHDVKALKAIIRAQQKELAAFQSGRTANEAAIDGGDLLFVIAKQEVDRMALVETLRELGGQEAVDLGLSRCSMVLEGV